MCLVLGDEASKTSIRLRPRPFALAGETGRKRGLIGDLHRSGILPSDHGTRDEDGNAEQPSNTCHNELPGHALAAAPDYRAFGLALFKCQLRLDEKQELIRRTRNDKRLHNSPNTAT
jgi:hypothetical protein